MRRNRPVYDRPYDDDDEDDRRYADEEHGPRRRPARAPQSKPESNVITTLAAVLFYLAAACAAAGFAYRTWMPASLSTTTAPQAQPTPYPTAPSSGGGAFANAPPTPVPAAATQPPADPSYLAVVSSQQRRLRADGLPCAPRDSDAGCGSDAAPTAAPPATGDVGGIDLATSVHVGSDGVSIGGAASISNGSTATPEPETNVSTQSIAPVAAVLVPTVAPAIAASYAARGSGSCPAGQVFVPRVGCHAPGSGGAMPGAVTP